MSIQKAGSTPEALNRRSWVLGGLPIVVVIELAAGVPLFYIPLLGALPEQSGSREGTADAYFRLTSLTGLVLIFCLYTALKHRELNNMRAALAREEREKENVRTRLSELSALFQVSTALNLQLRLDAILEIIVRRVVATLRAQQASVMIYNPESGGLDTRSTYGLECEYAKNAKKRMGEGIAGWVAERLEAVQLDGNDPHQTFGQHMKPNRKITSGPALPPRVGARSA